MEYVKIHMLMDLLWIGGSEVYIFVQYKKKSFPALVLEQNKIKILDLVLWNENRNWIG